MFVKNAADLLAHGGRQGRAMALDIIEHGLAAVDPYANVRRLVRVEGERLLVGGQPDMDVSGFGDEEIDLAGVRNVYVVGAGKAVLAMARALEDILGERISGGAITVKRGEAGQLRRIAVTEGAHPVPDEGSLAGTRRILEIAQTAGPDDLVFTLFSSGASSLFVLPAPGFDLADVQAVYRLAIKYGHQTIIHRVMAYFSAVSCGRVVRTIWPARTVNFILALDRYERWRGRLHTGGSWIPSWPPGPRRLPEAARELRAEPWWEELPAGMRAALTRADPAYEVPDVDDFRAMPAGYWQPVDSHLMLAAAKRRAEELGLRGVILGSWFWALGATVMQVLAGVAKEAALYGNPAEPPVAIISGGELTVPVGNATGVGGRNQEFALGTVLRLGEQLSRKVVIAAVDSDGSDGPGTQLGGAGQIPFDCLAGGIVDDETLRQARVLGIDLAAELANHNASVPLHRLHGGIYTGQTGACAGDLRVVLVKERSNP